MDLRDINFPLVLVAAMKKFGISDILLTREDILNVGGESFLNIDELFDGVSIRIVDEKTYTELQATHRADRTRAN